MDGGAAVPFEARLGAISADENDGVRWLDCDIRPPILKQAAALFQDGLSVREVAAALRISKTEAAATDRSPAAPLPIRLRDHVRYCRLPTLEIHHSE